MRKIVPLKSAPAPAAALPLSPPKASHLLPTQPQPSAALQEEGVEDDGPVASTSRVVLSSPAAATKGKKRARDDEAEVEVNFNRTNLPQELNKYWAQRYRLFSLFDSGVQMDLEGWYSVTPELIAQQIAERCRSSVIVDAFCGVGGNAIQFAFTCERVIAIDISPTRLACAKHNAEIYGVADRITFVLADYTEWARDYAARLGRGEVEEEDVVEVLFLSPPWGGLDYLKLGEAPVNASLDSPAPKATEPSEDTPVSVSVPASRPYPLKALAPLPGDELFALARAVTPHVAYYLPRNVDLEEVSALATAYPRSDKVGKEDEVEGVEVEEERMSGKLKAVTCYFGDLATKNTAT